MDTYGNLGPFQDPDVRKWWDELEVETREDDHDTPDQ